MTKEYSADNKKVNFVYIDGNYVPSNKASISVFDHGFLYGDGVFDTICAWNGYLFRLNEHVHRLFHSAKSTRVDIALSEEEMCAAIVETVRRNELANAYVKVVATRGVSPEPLLDPSGCRGSVVIFARPFLWFISPEKIERGIRVKVVSTRRIPPQCLDPKVKSLNYQNSALAKIEATAAGCDDAIT